ncbi:uncharacterized protein NPIL_458801 [Nephila pilipes]|uniref:Secreted protein n=1 Tax=Nephila pilipes TaxID=299642 RepID=A0A8X6KKH1_NEPPI|nr:uncharacterized protein NPIL_458801 [Nephila pilipes]
MGRQLTLPLGLLILAGNNGVAFTPWIALPGEYNPDVHHPLLPGRPCHVETGLRDHTCSRPASPAHLIDCTGASPWQL